MERTWLEDQFKIAIGVSIALCVAGISLGMSTEGPGYLSIVAAAIWVLGAGFTLRALKLLMYLSKLYQVRRAPYYAWIGVAVSSSISVLLALRR